MKKLISLAIASLTLAACGRRHRAEPYGSFGSSNGIEPKVQGGENKDKFLVNHRDGGPANRRDRAQV